MPAPLLSCSAVALVMGATMAQPGASGKHR